MKWSNLKNYCCPKCNSTLKDIGEYHACTRQGCVFSINKPKFDEIVSQKQKPRESTEFQNPDDRLSELNNYGRKPFNRESFLD